MDSQELRAERAKLVPVIRSLAEKFNGDEKWSGEDEAKYDQVNKRYDDLSKQIDVTTRAEVLEAEQSDKIENRHKADHDDTAEHRGRRHANDTATEEDRCLAMQGWMLRQCDRPTRADHEAAAELVGVNIDAKDFGCRLRVDAGRMRQEWRAQSTSATAGGEMIPEGFVQNFETALLEFGGVRQVATVIRTETGNDLPWPYANDTSNTGELLAENASVNEQDIVTAALTLNAFKYSSKLIRVSIELIEDSAFNIVALLGTMLGERIGRITNTHFTTGNASSKPNGIVTASTLGVTAASTTAITTDELIDLVHAVDPAYRAQGASWMLNDGVVKLVRKLKDSTNQYLWQPGMQAGVPDMLYGYPMTVNQDMDAVPAATDISVIFGALSKYIVRDVANFRLRRLVERYADNDQEGFVAFSRHDGDLLDAGTNPVQHLKMAAS